MIWLSGALLTGFALDMLFGDPYRFPHIVRLMGGMIAALEKALRQALPKTPQGERAGGVLLVCIMTLVWTGIPFAALFVCYRHFPPLGYALESFLCWQLLSARSLRTESMKIYHNLQNANLPRARENLSRIVGRDTATLNEAGVIRATTETVAENASDGVAAPLFFLMLGGAPLACLYKAVNTMDSMLGYKNDTYLHFGRAAARTDDMLNLIPARLCALLMIAGAYLLRFDGGRAFRVWLRDRKKHASPNAAQTEAVCAGALGIRLAGPASYFGKKQDKPYIGDDTRPVRARDILDANRLMTLSSGLMLGLVLVFRVLEWIVIFYGTI